MPKTMHWRVVPGAVHVAVHTDEAPSDEDWDEYLDDVRVHGRDIKGVLVYTDRAGPSASQRSKSNKVFQELGGNFKMAIMAGSRLVVGMVTALSWAVGAKIKAFSTRDFEAAAEWLELEPDDRIKARVVLRQLARTAGRDIEAFAEESGRFRKKFH